MFGALKRGFRSMASLILVRNVVGDLRPKRTLAASRGFLAAARLSCIPSRFTVYMSFISCTLQLIYQGSCSLLSVTVAYLTLVTHGFMLFTYCLFVTLFLCLLHKLMNNDDVRCQLPFATCYTTYYLYAFFVAYIGVGLFAIGPLGSCLPFELQKSCIWPKMQP